MQLQKTYTYVNAKQNKKLSMQKKVNAKKKMCQCY